MKKENFVLRKMALESLNGKWGLAIGGYVVFIAISMAVSFVPVAGSIASLIITGPLVLGIAIFSLAISRNQEAKVHQVFDGFNHFGKALATYLLMLLFIILWSLLLIIPGIIAGLSYSMAFYIFADNPTINAMEAIDRSKQMMYGYKWKLFLLQLSFIGWGLLCLLTFGIGFLWLMPYMQISFAKFYDDIKGEQVVDSSNQEAPKTEETVQAEVVNNPVVA
jgi:uncharacterized membrane protein